MSLPQRKNTIASPSHVTSPSNSVQTNFTTVTEYPGVGASPEQLDMLRTRYERARTLCIDKDALEIACGTGTGLGYVGRTARTLRGNDIDAENIKTAQKHYQNRFEIDWADASALPYPDSSFDVVFLLETIYYLPDPEACAREVFRVLRPGGTYLISSANREWTMFNPSPFARRYFAAGELQGMLDRVGFTKIETLAGFPDRHEASWIRTLRHFAVRSRLIPETMAAKEKIKRMVYGPLAPIPAEVDETTGTVRPVFNIDLAVPVSNYKILYAIGKKP